MRGFFCQRVNFCTVSNYENVSFRFIGRFSHILLNVMTVPWEETSTCKKVNDSVA